MELYTVAAGLRLFEGYMSVNMQDVYDDGFVPYQRSSFSLRPVLTMSGEERWPEFGPEGGPCDMWVDEDGARSIEMVAAEESPFVAREYLSRVERFQNHGVGN